MCWFNCKEKTFEKRTGKNVIGLHWKIITPELEQIREIQLEGFKNLLRVHFGFKEADMNKLEPIFNHVNDFAKLNVRIIEIRKYVADNRAKIANTKAYTIQCLLREFSAKEAKEEKGG